MHTADHAVHRLPLDTIPESDNAPNYRESSTLSYTANEYSQENRSRSRSHGRHKSTISPDSRQVSQAPSS